MVKNKEKVEEKEKKIREPIKPILIVPKIDKEKHAVFETTTKEDAELLKTAFDGSSGVKVVGPREEEEKVCPSEPEKPYSESICKKLEDLFEKDKEKEREAEFEKEK